MCHLSKKDQYVCQINQGIAEAVTGVLGGAQFPLCPFYHPRSSRCRLGHTREADVCAGNVPDSNGISGDFKRQKRSHQTEPVPPVESGKNQIPPDLVVKFQAIDIIGLILSLIRRKTSSKHRVDQGDRALSCSHYLRVIGLPLNSSAP